MFSIWFTDHTGDAGPRSPAGGGLAADRQAVRTSRRVAAKASGSPA